MTQDEANQAAMEVRARINETGGKQAFDAAVGQVQGFAEGVAEALGRGMGGADVNVQRVDLGVPPWVLWGGAAALAYVLLVKK